ncbi:hypothetical protein ABZ215_25040 [Amycolatopsis sp. NPDC006131]|uniref:hypothetical protein n=1 Tax=Amycolatopsis sp. NPDC006131 TaxID=3156731 RepID=UPI0033B6E92A
MLDELDVTITRQGKVVGPPVGVVVRTKETPLPFHDPASELRIAVYRDLLAWGVTVLDHNPHLLRVQRTAVETADWLATIPGLLASLPGAGDMHANLLRRRKEVEKMIDRAPTTVMLGKCSAVTDDGECPRFLYAALDDENRPPPFVSCPLCGAEHSVFERQRHLVAQGRIAAGTAAEVSRVLSRIGIQIAASTIRGYAQRRVSRNSVIEPRIHAVDVTAEGAPVYEIASVLDAYMASKTKKKGKAA